VNEKSKLQNPNSKQARSSKFQFMRAVTLAIGVWDLEFVWILEFGFWSFPLLP
jgi:hypothetical protein